MTDKVDYQKNVPATLKQEFLNGTKDPVTSIMEYSTLTSSITNFNNVPVEPEEGKSVITGIVANVCKVNGRVYPQGTGRTEKEAMANAAKIAFNSLLGLNYKQKGEFHVDVYCQVVVFVSVTHIRVPTPPEFQGIPRNLIIVFRDLEIPWNF